MNWFLLAELRNLLSFFRKAKSPSKKSLGDYTIVVPVWGNHKTLSFLEKRANKTIFLTKPRNLESLNRQLNRLKSLGARVFEIDLKGYFGGDSYKYAAIVKCMEENQIQTKYIVFIDADSYFRGDVGKVVQFLEEENLDFVSVKVVPNQHSNLLEKLQGLEYVIAMRCRHYLPWAVSGACLIIKTESLKKILRHHTLFFSGGDFEIGFLGKLLHMKIAHVDFKVYTRVPRTIKGLFKQRKRWWGGAFRHVIVNADKTIRMAPLYFFYLFPFVYLLYPFRWIFPFLFPQLIPIIWIAHVVITIIVSWRKPSYLTLLFPLYGFLQLTLMLLPIFGIIEWFKNYRKTGDTGRFRI